MSLSLIHPINITESFIIPGNIFLAPMAGFTDLPFRSLCIEYGAYFSYTEMVSSQAASRKNEKTLKLLVSAKNEKIFGVQIFASDARVAEASIKEIIPYKPSIIDLNCGCSIPKILKSGSGAALLANPLKISEILAAIRNSTDIPFSIKIRSGTDAGSVNYLSIGELAEKAGASLITLHPRTRSDVFRGKANWEHIKLLKQSLSIPVIGSGDLFTPEAVKNMLESTGCDGVMIARGAIGNPFIFTETEQLLTKGSYDQYPPIGKIFETAMRHLRLMIEYKGESKGCMEMRKHFCSYTKGIPDSAKLRNKIVMSGTFSEYEEIVGEYLANSASFR
jgi:tRNA-dihydrouridine synthase B